MTHAELCTIPLCSNCKNSDGLITISKDYKPKEGFKGYCKLRKMYIDQKVIKFGADIAIEGMTFPKLDCNAFELSDLRKTASAISSTIGGIFNFFKS